ncbi:MAG: threonine/serine exporter family protein [Erysipelotrichaceae bacterium]
MISHLIGAFIGTLGFSILFKIKKDKIIYCSLIGLTSTFVYDLLLYLTKNNYFSLLGSSIVVSIICQYLARKLKTPVTIFLAPGIICLVPGALIYQTMLDIIMGNQAAAVSNGLSTLSISGMIALGVLIVSSIYKTKKNPS